MTGIAPAADAPMDTRDIAKLAHAAGCVVVSKWEWARYLQSLGIPEDQWQEDSRAALRSPAALSEARPVVDTEDSPSDQGPLAPASEALPAVSSLRSPAEPANANAPYWMVERYNDDRSYPLWLRWDVGSNYRVAPFWTPNASEAAHYKSAAEAEEHARNVESRDGFRSAVTEHMDMDNRPAAQAMTPERLDAILEELRSCSMGSRAQLLVEELREIRAVPSGAMTSEPLRRERLDALLDIVAGAGQDALIAFMSDEPSEDAEARDAGQQARRAIHKMLRTVPETPGAQPEAYIAEMLEQGHGWVRCGTRPFYLRSEAERFCAGYPESTTRIIPLVRVP